MNISYRSTGELVALDYAYIYRIVGSELKCRSCDEHPIVKYTPDYDKLVCPHCRKQYSFMDIRRSISKDMEQAELQLSRNNAIKLTSPTQVMGEYDEDKLEDKEKGSGLTYLYNINDKIYYEDKIKGDVKMRESIFEEELNGKKKGIHEEDSSDDFLSEIEMLMRMKNGEDITEEIKQQEIEDEEKYETIGDIFRQTKDVIDAKEAYSNRIDVLISLEEADEEEELDDETLESVEIVGHAIEDIFDNKEESPTIVQSKKELLNYVNELLSKVELGGMMCNMKPLATELKVVDGKFEMGLVPKEKVIKQNVESDISTEKKERQKVKITETEVTVETITENVEESIELVLPPDTDEDIEITIEVEEELSEIVVIEERDTIIYDDDEIEEADNTDIDKIVDSLQDYFSKGSDVNHTLGNSTQDKNIYYETEEGDDDSKELTDEELKELYGI